MAEEPKEIPSSTSNEQATTESTVPPLKGVEVEINKEVHEEQNEKANEEQSEKANEEQSEKANKEQKKEQVTEEEKMEVEESGEQEKEQLLEEEELLMEESGETTDTSSEKANESRDYFDEDEMFQCLECKTKECAMWRKSKDKQGVICNLCHLERIKGDSATNAPGQGGTNSNNNAASSSTNKTSSSQMQPPMKAKDVRISKRKNKQNKKFTNGFYGDRIIKSGHSKSRRSLYKRKPMKSVLGSSAIVASQSIYHDGLLYRVGDIVCTSDIEGGTYYAQLRGFLQDEYCEKSAVITWLIPTKRNVTKFDPMLFVPGLDEETPRPMSCFSFVCRASTNLFKAPNMHPPYHRSQCDLNNLIHVANAMNTESTEDQRLTTEGES